MTTAYLHDYLDGAGKRLSTITLDVALPPHFQSWTSSLSIQSRSSAEKYCSLSTAANQLQCHVSHISWSGTSSWRRWESVCVWVEVCKTYDIPPSTICHWDSFKKRSVLFDQVTKWPLMSVRHAGAIPEWRLLFWCVQFYHLHVINGIIRVLISWHGPLFAWRRMVTTRLIRWHGSLVWRKHRRSPIFSWMSMWIQILLVISLL